MRSTVCLIAGALLWPVISGLPAHAAAPIGPLVAQRPVVVPGGPGGYDFMTVDATRRRLLAAHKGKGSLAVLDLDTRRVLRSVPTGAAQGVAVDARDGKYFIGDDTEQKVVVLNRASLSRIAEIPVSGPVDCVAVDPKDDLVYADHDDGTEVWVIDGRTNRLVGSVKVSGAPEVVEYDPITARLYQNIKVNNTVQVINPRTNRVEKTWSTLPATGPHGLVIDARTGRLFAAGSNGKLVVIDLRSGRVISSANIATGVDQIAFDVARRRIYCACRGTVSVAEETAGGVRSVGSVPSPRGAHTIAVDPKTHSVWVCYADASNSYLMEFVPR